MHALLLALLLQNRVDNAVRIVMQSQHVAGLSLGVARGGHTVLTRGYGERDVLRHLPATPQTVYRIGSLTKMFTARAVTALAAHGTLGLSRPAGRYAPHFPWGRSVTVRDLLAQRSGIPSYTDDPSLNPYAWYAPGELVAAVARLPLQFAPGTQFAYSNTNYVLLGAIVENIVREPFADYLNARVVAPFHLNDTRYGDQPGEALGYVSTGGTWVRATPSTPAYAFAAAAMTSNVPDLLRFLGTMRPPYYGLLQSEQFGSGVWYASGNVDGYSAFAFVTPQSGDEAVVLCNADKIDLTPLALDIAAAMRSADMPGRFGPPQNEDPRITALVKQRAAAIFAPLRIGLLEFVGRENGNANATVVYRVTLSDGSRVLLRAPVKANGSLGELSITPL